MADVAPWSRPDVLVLGVGGIAGEAWIAGVLTGLGDATGIDFADVEYVVGTSGGGIVAARLLSSRGLPVPSKPLAEPTHPDVRSNGEAPHASESAVRLAAAAGRLGLTVGRPLVPATMGALAPGGRIARALLLSQLPRPLRGLGKLHRSIEGLDTVFDGRLRIVAVDRGNGRRVVFGSPGAPDASVADAVTASCAIPWTFAPVRIEGREYVDGGVWSPTNADVAPAHRGSQVLVLAPTGHLTDGVGTPAGVLRTLGVSATAMEAAALRRRGARVTVIGPDPEAGRVLGNDLLDPAGRERCYATGLRQGRELAAAGVPAGG
jgi:NTE family protein